MSPVAAVIANVSHDGEREWMYACLSRQEALGPDAHFFRLRQTHGAVDAHLMNGSCA